MSVEIIHSLDAIPADEWDSLVGTDSPFLRHNFLHNLERHGCVGKALGWIPQHMILRDAQQKIIGAMPCYLKTNSYGELVFDWAWADAYQRTGRRYYPKLVAAIPYTPVTGPRILHAASSDLSHVTAKISQACIAHAKEWDLSSVHILFPNRPQLTELEKNGFMARLAYQFHWENNGYRDFQDFISQFNSRKRKNTLKERRKAQQSGVDIEVINGCQASNAQWQAMDRFYRTTFDEKGGIATFNLPFFQAIAEKQGEQIILFLAKRDGQYIAGALCYRDHDTLYGRHWGCDEDVEFLHFEICYYRGIEYAIEHGLSRFEPGAQGEHKISRGFLPTPVWSAHWLQATDFSEAIADYLHRETLAMQQYAKELTSLSPFKQC